MNKKGFTLIELLAVIAILALLVIIAVPNVLKIFNNSKKSVFENEAREIFNVALTQFQLDYDNIYSDVLYASGTGESGTTPLSLTGNKNIKYSIKLDFDGAVKCFSITNGSFYYKNTTGLNSVSEIKQSDIIEINDTTSFDITNSENNCSNK